MSEENLEEIKKRSKESGLSISDFIQLQCLDLEVEEEIIEIKKKKVLVKRSYGCNRCGGRMTVEEKEYSSICQKCDNEMMQDDEEEEEEQPF